MGGYDTWLTPTEKVGSFEIRCEKTTAVCGNCGFTTTKPSEIRLADEPQVCPECFGEPEYVGACGRCRGRGIVVGHVCPKCKVPDFWADQCGHVFMAECHWQEPGSVELLHPDRCPECESDDAFVVSDPDPEPPSPDRHEDIY